MIVKTMRGRFFGLMEVVGEAVGPLNLALDHVPVKPILWLALLLSVAGSARADIIRLAREGTEVRIDTAAAAVTVRYKNGFSNLYKNGTTTGAHKFMDETESSYTSTQTVEISEGGIRFTERYQTDHGLSVIDNVIDRRTGMWRSDENGNVFDKKCAGF